MTKACPNQKIHAPIVSLLAKDVKHDDHGNVQLSVNGALADLRCEEIKSKLKIKRVRSDTFGYLQRSFIGCVSDVDQWAAVGMPDAYRLRHHPVEKVLQAGG